MQNRLVSLAKAVWPPLPVWRRLDAAVFAVIVYTAGIATYFEFARPHLPNWSGLTTLSNTIVLGVLLQFRNRESYDRWWEARRLWGQLVNDSRNLCLKVATLPGLASDDRGELGHLVVGFAVALKNHLRGGKPLQAVPGFEADPIAAAHVPLEFATRTMALLRTWRIAGKVTEIDLLLLDPHARGQSDVLGACERIKSTPLPLSYRSLLRHGLVLYLLTSPWMIVDEIGWWGIPAIALMAYFMLGIELTAEDVEEPFGRDGDDLTLSTYCETIRKSVDAVL